MSSYSLEAKKWKTVATYAGAPVDMKATISVSTSKKCRWRRIGVVPGFGNFEGSTEKWLGGAGIIQVRSPVATTCTTSLVSPSLGSSF